LLSLVLWFFATTGGLQIFVKGALGGAYDSQAEHFLRGNVDVDAEAIGHEAMIVNGHVRIFRTIPRVHSYSAKSHLSSRAREMVANFRILCRRDRRLGLCRLAAHGIEVVPAFLARA
jgi:hypothetical protein